MKRYRKHNLLGEARAEAGDCCLVCESPRLKSKGSVTCGAAECDRERKRLYHAAYRSLVRCVARACGATDSALRQLESS